MGEWLEDALSGRLTEILKPEPTTESELRRLAEEADACQRILRGQLERRRSRLDALTAEPSSSFADIVAEVRHVRELSAELDELRELRDGLEVRARELRAGWLAQSAPGRQSEQ